MKAMSPCVGEEVTIEGRVARVGYKWTDALGINTGTIYQVVRGLEPTPASHSQMAAAYREGSVVSLRCGMESIKLCEGGNETYYAVKIL